MGFIPAPNVVSLEFRQRWRSLPVENILYFKKDVPGPWTDGDMSNLAVAAQGWFVANINSQQSADIALTEIFITDLTSDTAPTHSRVSGMPNVGDDPVPSVASNQALKVAFITAGRGRSSRGGNYVPGLRASQLAGNYWIPLVAGAIQDAYNLLPDLMLDQGFVWGVLSRRHNKADRVTGLFQPIQNASVRSLLVASQEPRKR